MTQAESVWVIDDDQSIRWVLEKALEKAHMDVKSLVAFWKRSNGGSRMR